MQQESMAVRPAEPLPLEVSSPLALIPQAPVLPAERAPGWSGQAVAIAMKVLGDALAVVAAITIAGWPTSRGLVSLAVWPAVIAAAGLYGTSGTRIERARHMTVVVALACLATAAVQKLVNMPIRQDRVLLLGAVAMVLLAAERRGLTRLLSALAPKLGLEQRMVIVGTNHEARTLARSLVRGARPGVRLVGFVGPTAGQTIDGLPVLGDYPALDSVLAEFRAQSAVVASTSLEAGALADVCARLQAAGVQTSLSVGLPAVAATRVSVDAIDGLAVLQVSTHRLSRGQTLIKRSVDMVGAAALLLIGAPIALGTALAIRLTSGAGVIYSQVRVGEAGRPFRFYKFRTMVHGADEMVIDLRERNQADGHLFKLFDDPRVTSVGRFLRRYGLDELPQLWNVLKGDMSLVGPRPPLPEETERYDEWIRGRLRVKPGITGLWQVNGRHALSWDDYVHYDLFYVENWSLSMDVSVILRTLPALISHRGAY